MADRPIPQVFPTEGPRESQYAAYDPDRFDVCGDPDCSCRRSKNNITGYGATPEDAIADFWEKYDE